MFRLPGGGPVSRITQSVARHPGRSLAIAGGGTVAAYFAAALAFLWRLQS
jgi:hypothetical protein